MFLTYQYRLEPTAADLAAFQGILDQDRTLYNAALQERIDAWRKAGKSISYNDQTRSLAEIRQDNFPGHSVRQRGVLRRLDKTFKAFFQRVKRGQKPGFPRFKGKEGWDSLEVGYDYRIKSGRFHSKDFPTGLKIRWSRPFPEDMIKHCGTVIKRRAGRWFISFKIKVPTPDKKPVVSAIGIDMGLSSFLTTSDGRHISNPRHFKRTQKALRRKQRLLARARRGSKSHAKKKLMVARAFLKVANQRKDFHHKISHDLVNRYNSITAENLNIKGMVKNRFLSKSIHDAGWGLFLDKIAYKAERAGSHFVKVDPKGTSQHCSTCGKKVEKTLSQRTHECPSCGLIADRDLNAAINIRKLGQSFASLTAPLGAVGAEVHAT